MADRTPHANEITIRPAHLGDLDALAHLAALDSAERTPPLPALVAEVDGVLRVALSLDDDTVIADPFFPTLHVVALLRAHAAGAARRFPLRRRLRLSLRAA